MYLLIFYIGAKYSLVGRGQTWHIFQDFYFRCKTGRLALLSRASYCMFELYTTRWRHNEMMYS